MWKHAGKHFMVGPTQTLAFDSQLGPVIYTRLHLVTQSTPLLPFLPGDGVVSQWRPGVCPQEPYA